jgi:hypothetical protein
MQPAEGYPGGFNETINGGARVTFLHGPQIYIESVSPDALKIHAQKGGILTNGESALSPFSG